MYFACFNENFNLRLACENYLAEKPNKKQTQSSDDVINEIDNEYYKITNKHIIEESFDFNGGQQMITNPDEAQKLLNQEAKKEIFRILIETAIDKNYISEKQGNQIIKECFNNAK